MNRQFRNNLLIIFVIFVIVTFFIQQETIVVEAARNKTTEGIYTVIDYTSELFPDYEEFTISFFIKRTDYLLLEKNESFFITGYRIVLNTTLLAYVAYHDVFDYKPELEKITLTYDRSDWNLTQSDYNAEHKLTIQISSVAIDPEGNEKRIADDIITTTVFFEREATAQEVLSIVLFTLVPLIVLSIIFAIHHRLNERTFENVTYSNMLYFMFRRIKKRRVKKYGRYYRKKHIKRKKAQRI
ncbi:MAG: hypothetical protein K9W46_00050 [Candidatus Heimdallarchaeum endolithica]|uniref:Uncharacterized protein n=1 Tax=Candidatus Heimdallarchaeum endolithica TaxID=2876572 RepID=A0A9Y1FPE0_9ARCH|nr:MAG: hypothetical protein K9W46_00050 [Candidatus Heimdallarchaeum endolithica]